MRKLNLSPEKRLIVAADFKPAITATDKLWDVQQQLFNLIEELNGTGVIIKLNSLLRAFGYSLVGTVQSLGLDVFADLKLNDISKTHLTDGMLLRQYNPAMLTVMCSTGVAGLKALKAQLPKTEVLGVTTLTTLNDDDTQLMFSCSAVESVRRFAKVAEMAGVDGLISSPAEVEMLRRDFGIMFTLNTPGVRPLWATVPGDDQDPDRVMTPKKAIEAGADRVVVGRPITQAENRYDAVMRTIEEIASVTN